MAKPITGWDELCTAVEQHDGDPNQEVDLGAIAARITNIGDFACFTNEDGDVDMHYLNVDSKIMWDKNCPDAVRGNPGVRLNHAYPTQKQSFVGYCFMTMLNDQTVFIRCDQKAALHRVLRSFGYVFKAHDNPNIMVSPGGNHAMPRKHLYLALRLAGITSLVIFSCGMKLPKQQFIESFEPVAIKSARNWIDQGTYHQPLLGANGVYYQAFYGLRKTATPQNVRARKEHDGVTGYQLHMYGLGGAVAAEGQSGAYGSMTKINKRYSDANKKYQDIGLYHGRDHFNANGGVDEAKVLKLTAYPSGMAHLMKILMGKYKIDKPLNTFLTHKNHMAHLGAIVPELAKRSAKQLFGWRTETTKRVGRDEWDPNHPFWNEPDTLDEYRRLMAPKGPNASSYLRRGRPFTKEQYIEQAEMYLHLHRIFTNQGRCWGRRNEDTPNKIQREQYCAVLSMLGQSVSRGMPSLTLTTWQPRLATNNHKGQQVVAMDGSDQGAMIQLLEEHDERTVAWNGETKQFHPKFVAKLKSQFPNKSSNVLPAVDNDDDDLQMSERAARLEKELKMYLHHNGTWKCRYKAGASGNRGGAWCKEKAATKKQLAVIIDRDVIDTSDYGRWKDGEKEKEMEVGLEVRNLGFEQMTRKWRLFRSYVEGHATHRISELDDMVKRLQVSQYKLTKQCLNYRRGGRAKTFLWEQQLWHWAFQQAYITNEKGHALWGTSWRNKLLLAVVLVVADESDDEAGGAVDDDDDDNDDNDGNDGNDGNWGGYDDDDYSASSSSSVNNGDHLKAMARKKEAARRNDDDDDDNDDDDAGTSSSKSSKSTKRSRNTRPPVVRQPVEELLKELGIDEHGNDIDNSSGEDDQGESITELYNKMQKEEDEKARLAQMSSNGKEEWEPTMSV